MEIHLFFFCNYPDKCEGLLLIPQAPGESLLQSRRDLGQPKVHTRQRGLGAVLHPKWQWGLQLHCPLLSAFPLS